MATKSIEKKKKTTKETTKITIKHDCGFSNALFIRGHGADLSWNKGHPLKNVKADEWVWESKQPFTLCEFKILLNDKIYEAGDNHLLSFGEELVYSPNFH